MPIFDFICTSCGHCAEHIVRRFDDVIFCENCGEQARRLVTAGQYRNFRIWGVMPKGGGPDKFTADMLGIPLKDLPRGLKS